jgi:hypothetical protein
MIKNDGNFRAAEAKCRVLAKKFNEQALYSRAS